METAASTSVFLRITLTVKEAKSLLQDMNRTAYNEMTVPSQKLYEVLTQIAGGA